MADDVIVGLDAGTSVIKAVAFDPAGYQVAKAVCDNELHYTGDGGVEQDPGRTWAAAAETLRTLAAEVPGLVERVSAVAVTGQGDGTWLLDAEGQPVGRSMLWLDARSSDIVSRWRNSSVGSTTYASTGTGLNQSAQSGQLKWLSEHQPQRLARAATVCHCKDWLYHCLTGERATDPTEAVWTFGSYQRRDYDDAVLEAFGLSAYRRLLPPIVDGTREHAALHRRAAAETGLKAGTPVVLAPVDMLATGLGAGVYDPHRRVACSIVGSTGAHLYVRHRESDIVLHDQASYTMPFVAPGTWLQLASNMAATLNIDWFVDGLNALFEAVGQPAVDRTQLLGRVDAAIARVPPGRLIYHPFICTNGERGPFVNPQARAQFLGLDADTTQLDMARAIYEGIAFAARDCYAALDAAPEEVRITGGGAQSATLAGILASVLGVPVRPLVREEAGAAGAAMVATLALGHYSRLEDVCAQWVTPHLAACVSPDPALQQVYERLFPVYRDAYAHSDEFWRAFHAAGNPSTPRTALADVRDPATETK